MQGVLFEGLTSWELIVTLENGDEVFTDINVWACDLVDALNKAEVICNKRYGNKWVSYSLI